MFLILTNILNMSLALPLVARIIMEHNDNKTINDRVSLTFQALS